MNEQHEIEAFLETVFGDNRFIVAEHQEQEGVISINPALTLPGVEEITVRRNLTSYTITTTDDSLTIGLLSDVLDMLGTIIGRMIISAYPMPYTCWGGEQHSRFLRQLT